MGKKQEVNKKQTGSDIAYRRPRIKDLAINIFKSLTGKIKKGK